MQNQERIARSKQVLGLNVLGCLLFVLLMLFSSVGKASIPLRNQQDTSKRYQSKSKVHSYSYHSNGHRWKSRNNFTSMDIQYRGEIRVNDNDTDITSISPGGYLKIKKTIFGNTRSIIIESNSAGELTREYYEGRKKVEFNDEGRKWLADILLEVVRHTGIAANDRVNRIYKQGGTDAVITEIKQIDSSSGKGRYFRELMGICDQKDFPALGQKIGQYISSNSVRSEIFREYSDKFMATPEGTEAFFQGVDYMTSNSERSNILRHTLRTNKLDNKGMVGLLRVTRRMTSNSERASILREVNEQFPEDESGIEAYFDVISSMTSNSEKGSVLKDLMRQKKPSEKVMKLVLQATAREFTSNSEMGSVLRVASSKLKGNPTLLQLYIEAIGRMTSNTSMGTSLADLIDSEEIQSDDVKVSILRSLRRMTSSTERGRILRRTINFLGKKPMVDDAYFEAVSGISSSSEKGYVLKEVINKVKMTQDMSLRILNATRYITSSSEVGNIMVALSRVMPKNDQKVRDAFQTAARRISSNSEYRRVIESLNR
ncbi:MAG: hypothetical protein ACPGJS_18305 [Flammeovirgaceae bacterium]